MQIRHFPLMAAQAARVRPAPESGPDDVPDEFDNDRRGGGPDDSSDPDFGNNRGGSSYDGPDGRYDYDPYF